MKIYTRHGDAGQTGLFGENHVSKASHRVAAYGDVDELNSVLGIARLHCEPEIDAMLARVQSELFTVGAELSTSPKYGKEIGIALVSDAEVVVLEREIDACDTHLTPLTTFILPGGSPAAAHLHHARTVCRRAERHVVALASEEPVRLEVIRYLNRMSDWLFTLARWSNRKAGVVDVPWVGRQ